MRSFPTLGFISLVGALALVGCGDDEGGDGNGGSAGTNGNAGNAGGGMGGNAGGGMGGNGGTSMGGNGGTGGAPTAIDCDGCVELELPVVAGERNLGFQFTFEEPLDMSTGTITWRVQVLPEDANANFFVQTFVANGPPEDPMFAFNNYANYTALTPANFASGMWREIVHNVGALPLPAAGDAGAVDAGADAGAVLTAFDKRVVRFAGIQIGAAAANTTVGTVRVFVDSATFANITGAPAGTFATSAEGLAANNYQNIPGVVPPTHIP